MRSSAFSNGTEARLVTVVIPTHNDAQYLPESVGSVLMQDMAQDVEILIVDDGSEPAAKDILHAPSGNIRFLYQAAAGAGAARNRGIKAAAGQYIAFLDADDLMLPGRLRRQVGLLERHPVAGLLATDTTRRSLEGNEDTWGLFETFPRPVHGSEVEPGVFLLEESFTRLFVLAYPFHTSAVIRTEALAQSGVRFNQRYQCYEEWDFFVRLARHTRVLYDRNPGTTHRKRPGSITTTPDPGKFLSRGEMQRRWRLEFADLSDDTSRALACAEAESFTTASWLFRKTSRGKAFLAALKAFRARQDVAGLRAMVGAVLGQTGAD